MNFSDIREQILERLNAVWAQIEESSAYSELRERYESLPRAAQRAAVVGVVALIALIALMLPWSYFSASGDSVAEFERRKTLIKDIFRTNRAAEAVRNAPQPTSASELLSRIQSKLPSLGLSQEQIGNVAPYDNAAGGHALAATPKGVLQQGVLVQLKSLNLRQAVDVGYELNALDPATKMMGVQIAATASDAHYFDVVYKLVSYSMPLAPEPAAPAPKGGKKAAKPSHSEN